MYISPLRLLNNKKPTSRYTQLHATNNEQLKHSKTRVDKNKTHKKTVLRHPTLI